MLGDRTYTVNTTYALHKTGGVPRCIVVDYYICPVEIDSFGKDIRGENDIVIIVLVLVIGIEVFSYGLELAASVFCRYYQYIFAVDAFGQVFNGID